MFNSKFCSVWKPTAEDKDEIEQQWLEKRKGLLTASDIGAALGDNPFKTPVELWEEKTGRRAARDLSDNPYVAYGVENEDRLREQFMKDNGEWLRIMYHPRDIYISKETPFLGATLDGELEITSYENKLNLARGAKGVLEIKTAAFKSRDAYEAWNECPLHYKEQVLGQMYVTGAEFNILFAELRFDGDKEFQGNLPDYDYRVFMFIRNEMKDAIVQLVGGVKDFWQCVEEDRMPTLPINSSDAVMQLVQSDVQIDVELKAETKIGMFVDNFSEMQLGIMEMVKPFEGLVFTPEQTKDAKKIKADLNKKKKTIEDVRKSLKKEYCKPLEEFEDRAKRLVSIIDNAIIPIDAQIKQQEENEKSEKGDRITDLWMEKLETLDEARRTFFMDNGFAENDPRWLNKTTSLKTVEADMDAIIGTFLEDYDSIHAQAEGNTDLLAVMMNAFADSHKLGFALTAKMRYLSTKKQEDERLAAEARRKADIEATAQAEKEKQAEMAEKVPATEEKSQLEQEKPQKEIVFTFKAAHTSAKEWANLIKYMAEHGFRYTQVK